MFTIIIEELKVDAVIGILDSERLNPQPVFIDCFIDYVKDSDEYINYAEVVELIENMLVKNRYGLLEVALEDIIEKLFKTFKQIKNVKLKLSKPNILDNCIVGVELFRKI
jgi:dihydroneopterin aldolase